LIFDKNANPRFMYEEQTGSEIPVGDIATALEAVRRHGQQ